ncbi:MAG: DEAD/DEAH box helicase family protein [bacterium]|nr:DEAD/DEAH box helicase family protein [bacterium]
MVRKSDAPRPLPHQQACLKIIRKNLLAGITPMLFVMASGLGKTFTAAFTFQLFRRMAKRARVLVLAHQVDLLDQAKITFEQVFRDQLTYGHFAGRVKKADADAVFATMQSMQAGLFRKKRRGQRRPFGRRQFDCVIVDESHHGQAPTYREVIQYFRPKCLIGMTATPNRMDLKDIREIFGNEIFALDLEDALAQGLLTPVDYRILADEIVDKGKLKVPPHLVSIQQLNRSFFNRKRDREIVQIVLDRIAAVVEPRIIIFTSSIKHAELFAKMMPGAKTIHSRLPRVERQQRLALFRKGLLRVVVAVDQFNEGVDIPEANVLVFLRSTQSKTVFLQQLGRGLRRIPGKEHVLVLDFAANCERLAMVDELHREVKARTQKRGRARREIQVNWGQVVFEERSRDVLELVRQVKVGVNKDVLAQYLRDFYERHNRPPSSYEDFGKENGMPDPKTFWRHFGSLVAAYRYAGLPIDEFSACQRAAILRVSGMSHEEKKLQLAEQLRDFFHREKHRPRKGDFTPKSNLASHDTYRHYFGNVTKAMKFAELPADQGDTMAWRRMSKSARRHYLVDCLRRFSRERKVVPQQRDCTKAGGLPDLSTFRKYFGSLGRALRAAGLVSRRISTAARSKMAKLTKKERKEFLADTIRDFYRRHHRLPLSSDFAAVKKMPDLATYIRYFGRLHAAFRFAGFSNKEIGEKRLAASKAVMRRWSRRPRKQT